MSPAGHGAVILLYEHTFECLQGSHVRIKEMEAHVASVHKDQQVTALPSAACPDDT